MKTFDFIQSAISHNVKDPHSKALEPDCLSPRLAIMTQSPVGEDRGRGTRYYVDTPPLGRGDFSRPVLGEAEASPTRGLFSVRGASRLSLHQDRRHPFLWGDFPHKNRNGPFPIRPCFQLENKHGLHGLMVYVTEVHSTFWGHEFHSFHGRY